MNSLIFSSSKNVDFQNEKTGNCGIDNDLVKISSSNFSAAMGLSFAIYSVCFESLWINLLVKITFISNEVSLTLLSLLHN